MADEQAGIPASEASVEDRMAAFFGADASKQPSSEPEGPEDASASAEVEQEQTEEQAEEAVPEDSGFEEVELDGETYKVPPKLKEAVLRNADYTKKTQELAEHRRALQAQTQAIQLAHAYQQATADDQAALKGLESQIAQFKNVNWSELDSETLVKAKHQLDTLKEQANEVRDGLREKAQQFQQRSQMALAQFRAQRAESLQRLIPNWSQQSDIDATRTALEIGFTPEEIRDNFDARMGLLAWKAAQFDKLQTTKTAAVKQVQKAPPVVKPGASQGQTQVAANKYKEARDKLRKSGRIEDAAALFLQRMK